MRPEIASRPSPSSSGMQLRPKPQRTGLKSGTGVSKGPTNVLLSGVSKSTWKYQKCSTGVGLPSQFGWPVATIGFGGPAGGRVRPSRSVGSGANWLGSMSKKIPVAGSPAIIAVRSNAVTRELAEGSARELVGRHVVGVRPDAPLRVVRKSRPVLEVVAVVGARRIAGLGDGHADVELVLARRCRSPPSPPSSGPRAGRTARRGRSRPASRRSRRSPSKSAVPGSGPTMIAPDDLVVDVEDRVDELEVLRASRRHPRCPGGAPKAEERPISAAVAPSKLRTGVGRLDPKCRCTTVSTPLCSTPRMRRALVSRSLTAARRSRASSADAGTAADPTCRS